MTVLPSRPAVKAQICLERAMGALRCELKKVQRTAPIFMTGTGPGLD